MFNDIHIRHNFSGRVKNAQEVGLELCRIAKANKEQLTPEIVLKNAESESSPIHHCFTWDDSEAAKKCRLIEAQVLIRTVKITVDKHPQDAPVHIRAFVNIDRSNESTPDVKPDRAYVPIETVLSNPEYRKKMIQQAFSELSAFRNKYTILSELSGVFKAVDKAQKELGI